MAFKRLLAILVACVIMNFLCFFYYNPLHGSDLNAYRLEPDTIGVNMVEGFGILYADKNGFSNKSDPLIEEDYILVMGSSYSKADQIPVDLRYSGLLNKYLGYKEELGVYNLAYNGGKFDDIVKNFKELIEEFPDSKAVVIEVTDSQLHFDEDSYADAMNQIEMEDSIVGEQLKEHNAIGKIKLAVKKYCPLLLLYVNQYTQWQNSMKTGLSCKPAEIKDTTEDNKNDEFLWYSNMLNLLSEQYDKEIIVVYHNGFNFDKDNKMNTDLSQTGRKFIKACDENGIKVLNMTELFSKHFDEYREIPYGFWNTSLGTGHLNKVGHQLIAEELYGYLEGGKG